MARKPVVSTAMLTLMRERDRHAWTLDTLHAALAGRRIAANFSSVFRAAEKLVADGLLRKFSVDDGCVRFELAEAHHDHLHCMDCGALVAVPCPIGRAEFAALERSTGVSIRDHHLVLSGVCRDCAGA